MNVNENNTVEAKENCEVINSHVHTYHVIFNVFWSENNTKSIRYKKNNSNNNNNNGNNFSSRRVVYIFYCSFTYSHFVLLLFLKLLFKLIVKNVVIYGSWNLQSVSVFVHELWWSINSHKASIAENVYEQHFGPSISFLSYLSSPPRWF